MIPLLRPASIGDVPALADLGRRSFVAAFGHLYTAEDLATFLQASHDDSHVARLIADPANAYCLAIGEDGAIAGFCKMAPADEFAAFSSARRPIALSQLYTDPDATGRGIGAMLMEWALDHARKAQADAVLLSVWSENYGAQRFYARYGFTKIADIDFWVGNHRDDEFLFELRL